MLFSPLIEIVDPEPHDAALNMALDEALLRAVERPALRVYRWREPAVSFGHFGRFAEVEPLSAGREMVRRWTGGGIVEHGRDVTYTLFIPRGHPLCECRAPESYCEIHEVIARWLGGEGREVALAPASGAKISDECFANPVQFDLMAGGAKLAGAAQRRTRWGLLHQGSIQCAGVAGGLAGAFSADVHPMEITPQTRAAAAGLAREKYGATAWLRKF